VAKNNNQAMLTDGFRNALRAKNAPAAADGNVMLPRSKT